MTSAMGDSPHESNLSPLPSNGADASHHHTAYSEIDSMRFGYRIARNSQMTSDQIAATDRFCECEQIDMLIARCPTTDINSLLQLQASEYRIMDTLVRWRYDVKKRGPVIPHKDLDLEVRLIGAAEADTAAAIARAAFQAYDGHYHADPRLPVDQATEVYASWSENSCRSTSASALVFGADWRGALAGFVTFVCDSDFECDVPLAAVAPDAQGQGILTALLSRAINAACDQGGALLTYGCVLTNIGAQKALARLGFEIVASYHTLHKWYAPSA